MRILTACYFLLIPLLFILQLIFTLNSQNQIRYEELANSVRNVFWLEHHKVYNGVSGGVGWYAILLTIYNLFGFSLFTAKYVRLFLSLISLLSLSLLLFKYLKVKRAFLPLLAIGLSPTMLFLNSTQTEYGMDLQLLPILLLLLDSINFKGKWFHPIPKMILLWAMLMIGALIYPTFLYFVFLIGVLFMWKMKKFSIKYLTISLISFLLPLLAILLYLDNHNRNLFIDDSYTQSGIFRGAGSFQLDVDNSAHNLAGIFEDLFNKGESYHFEVAKGEFSDFLPALAIISIISLGILKTLKDVALRKITILIVVFMFANLVVSSLTFDPSGTPGIRRFTPTLAAIYMLFIIGWHKLSNLAWRQSWQKWGIIILFLVIPIHHLIVYPINLSHLKDLSPNKEPYWFAISQTPSESLDSLVNTVTSEDLKLVCLDEVKKPLYCRLAEVYAAVAGSCTWNHLDCKNIQGYDLNTRQFIKLQPQLWEEHYFEY